MGDGKTKTTAILPAIVSVGVVLALSVLVWVTWRIAPQRGAALSGATSVASAVAFTTGDTPTTRRSEFSTPRPPTPTDFQTPIPTPYDVLYKEPYVRATAYATNCDSSRSSGIWPQDLCSELRSQVLMTEAAQVAESQTAAAPTDDPLRTATPSPPPPTLSPYVLSATDLVIEPVDLGIRDRGDPHSLWRLGTIVGSRGEPYAVRLWGDSFTRDGQTKSTIGIEYLAMPDQPFESDPAMADRVWISPHDIGAVTITAVSGQKGIVSFKGEHGEHGTFDLATEQWTFEDTQTPGMQTAIATQQPVSAP